MVRTAIVAIGLLMGTTAHAETLNLVCLGAGSANKPTGAMEQVHNNRDGSTWGQVIANRSVLFEDQVDLKIDGASSSSRISRWTKARLRKAPPSIS